MHRIVELFLCLGLIRKPAALRQASSRIIFTLICIAFFIKVEAQYIKQDLNSSTLAEIKKSAVLSAKNYIAARLLDKQLVNRFIADSGASLIIFDDYKTFFNTNAVWSLPVGYEIAFHVVLETSSSWDTLHTYLFLPLDSSFRFKESLAYMWHHDLFEAWVKVISNKYKVNYTEVLQFARKKRLQHYSIDFGHEELNYRTNSKIFWFVMATVGKNRNKRTFFYRINPETGDIKVNVKKVLPIKLPKDVF